MPVRKVSGGWRWGSSGKVYPTRGQAERQGQAAYAGGYKVTLRAPGGRASGAKGRASGGGRGTGRRGR